MRSGSACNIVTPANGPTSSQCQGSTNGPWSLLSWSVTPIGAATVDLANGQIVSSSSSAFSITLNWGWPYGAYDPFIKDCVEHTAHYPQTMTFN